MLGVGAVLMAAAVTVISAAAAVVKAAPTAKLKHGGRSRCGSTRTTKTKALVVYISSYDAYPPPRGEPRVPKPST